MSGNTKVFYNYIKKKLKTRSIIPPLFDNNKEIITDLTQKSNLFNNHFSNCFLASDADIEQHHLPHISVDHQMKEIDISLSEITTAIKKLKSSVSRTPDGIPSLFVKKTAHNLLQPLKILFEQSLSQGQIPSAWTKALVVPIHKKGLRSNFMNYRPISLTSIFCRILESILHSHIYNHFTVNNLLSNNQHGFIEQRSTLTQQHIVVDVIAENTNKKIQTDIIMLDFSKAFDKVSHLKLISILRAYQVNTKVVNWISCLLLQRTQQTVVDNHHSSSIAVRSGVPQGSVLGPLLFNIYLNILIIQLEKVENLRIFAFADDLKLLSCDPSVLQQALFIVERWCSIFGLQLNPEKSEHISFSNKTPFHFHIGTKQIRTVDQVKDLGIIVDDNLKWRSHVTKITRKALSLSYVILLRCFSSREPTAYVQSYKSFVRPLLEYNTSVWNTSLITETKLTEQVQRTFTRKLLQKLNTPYNTYSDRLQFLKLNSLELRRLHFDLILVYKIIHGLIDLSFSIFFKPLNINYNLRHHRFSLCKQTATNNRMLNQSFKYRVVNAWNSLPNSVVESNTLGAFKRELKLANLSKFCL